MTKGRHARRKKDDEQEQYRSNSDDTGDFADEHESTTFADELRGGPEGRPEPESPSGAAGAGGMDPKSPGGRQR